MRNVTYYLVLVVVVAALLSGCGYGISNGEGEKVGHVVGLVHQGVLCRTWEGTLIRGGLTDGSGTMGAPFHFTVVKEELVPGLREAMEKNQEVKLSFFKGAYSGICTSEMNSEGFVTSFHILRQ